MNKNFDCNRSNNALGMKIFFSGTHTPGFREKGRSYESIGAAMIGMVLWLSLQPARKGLNDNTSIFPTVQKR